MTVTDSSVLVIDHLSEKQIEYRISSLQYIREERIFDKIWCTDLFTLSGDIYYVNDWSNSNAGKFRLFSLKNSTSHFNKYLPFDKEPLSLGINGPAYAVNGDEASLIYSGCDIIYRIKDGEVFPACEVKFKDKKVVYSSGKVENVFRDNPGSGRIIGINAINESDKYLFFDVSVTTKANKPVQRGNHGAYTCLYNKLNDETVIYPRLARNSLFDDEDVIIHRIIGNKLISWREAHMLLHQEKYVYAEKTFKNKAFESRLKEVLAGLTDDSNPVLFIYNLK
jgi:hypothetical protein